MLKRLSLLLLTIFAASLVAAPAPPMGELPAPVAKALAFLDSHDAEGIADWERGIKREERREDRQEYRQRYIAKLRSCRRASFTEPIGMLDEVLSKPHSALGRRLTDGEAAAIRRRRAEYQRGLEEAVRKGIADPVAAEK